MSITKFINILGLTSTNLKKPIKFNGCYKKVKIEESNSTKMPEYTNNSSSKQNEGSLNSFTFVMLIISYNKKNV